MKFATRPDGQDEPIVKDRANVVFGPVNADVTIDIPELQIASEQARQEAAAVTPTQTTITPDVSYLSFASGYWYTSAHVESTREGGVTYSSWANDTGVAYPLGFIGPCLIDAFGVEVTDNVGTPSTTPPPGGDYYLARVGIYSDANGFPGDLLGMSQLFCYGDGSMTANVLTVMSLSAPVSLPAGRYWLMLRKSGQNQLPNPAYIMSRRTLPSAQIGVTESTINSVVSVLNTSALKISFPTVVSGDPVLPEVFDPSLYTLDYVISNHVPEIWVRGA